MQLQGYVKQKTNRAQAVNHHSKKQHTLQPHYIMHTYNRMYSTDVI